MQKAGGLAAGGLAKGAGLFAKASGRFGGKGGLDSFPANPDAGVSYDAKPVEEPKALPGGRIIPADRILEKSESPTYTGRAPRGAKQLRGSSTSWNFGEKNKEPVISNLMLFKDGTKIKSDFAGDGSILSAKMKKPGSNETIDLTSEEFRNYYKNNLDKIEVTSFINRRTGEVSSVDRENKSVENIVLQGEKLKEVINTLENDEW